MAYVLNEQNEFYDYIVSYLPTSYIKIPCKVGVIAQKVTEWMCFAELHIYSFSPLVGQMALIQKSDNVFPLIASADNQLRCTCQAGESNLAGALPPEASPALSTEFLLPESFTTGDARGKKNFKKYINIYSHIQVCSAFRAQSQECPQRDTESR